MFVVCKKHNNLKPRIVASTTMDGWAAMVADVIILTVIAVVSHRGACNVMLTGGHTAERFYRCWAKKEPGAGRSVRSPDDSNSLSVRLALGGTCLLDDVATRCLGYSLI